MHWPEATTSLSLIESWVGHAVPGAPQFKISWDFMFVMAERIVLTVCCMTANRASLRKSRNCGKATALSAATIKITINSSIMVNPAFEVNFPLFMLEIIPLRQVNWPLIFCSKTVRGVMSAKPTMIHPFIQIAGINSAEEAAMLMRNGVEYLGFPLRLDVHAADLSEDDAAKIIKTIHAPHKAVLITYLDRAKEIASFMKFLGVDHLQLHGSIEIEELKKLRKINPNYFVIKSLVVKKNNEEELKKLATDFSPLVDAFITDTFDPTTGASGATGKTHDWNLSRALVQSTQKPVILAGGLNPSNVASAIREVSPTGVDVHTGVEDSRGNKDPLLVQRFIENARDAFALLSYRAP